MTVAVLLKVDGKCPYAERWLPVLARVDGTDVVEEFWSFAGPLEIKVTYYVAK
jgi:hypothetical protein